MKLWLLRIAVLIALAVTLTVAGPRAWTVLARRLPAHKGSDAASVDLQCVGFAAAPAWLRGPLLIAVLRDLEPNLRGRAGILDSEAAGRLRARLSASPWVEHVTLERVFPDRLRVALELRQPVLEVRRSDAALLEALVDAQGHSLPGVAVPGLPRVHLLEPGTPVDLAWGAPHPDPRVLAAAAVAVEWRDELTPLVADAPQLIEVDAANLGYRYLADGRWSEIRVGVRRGDGDIAYLGYGHPPGSAAPRVAAADKARVLRSLLQEYPGLVDVAKGDLRFVNRWRDWVLPRPEPLRPR